MDYCGRSGAVYTFRTVEVASPSRDKRSQIVSGTPKTKLVKPLLALVVATSALSAQAAPNLVTNGSFESQLQTSGTFGTYTFLTGWSTFSVEVRNNAAGTAQDGSNFVELDTSINSSITQMISITAPGTYQLSFWYDSRPDNGTRSKGTNKLLWSFGDYDGSVLSDWTVNTSGVWDQFSGTFSFAQVGDYGLTFSAAGLADSYGGSLDNVSVTAVPEPQTYAMLLAGLGLMGAIARRRSKQSQA